MAEKIVNGAACDHQNKFPTPINGIADRLSGVFHKLIAGSALKPGWLYPSTTSDVNCAAREGMLHLEIVSHCWQYSHFLGLQLSSLVLNPPLQMQVTMTVYYSKEDAATSRLLAFFEKQQSQNIEWNWQELPPQYLFRRAIGRNLAAKNSRADWVWFTDCDETFQADCLDTLNQNLQGRRDRLLYPAVEHKTRPLSDEELFGQEVSPEITSREIESVGMTSPDSTSGDNSQSKDQDLPQPVREPSIQAVDLGDFTAHKITRATGPLQITHGDIARHFGYCDVIDYYQKPATHWCKAHEDRVFRWLLQTQGDPIDVPGVYRIQHLSKGRQKSTSAIAPLRNRIRNRRYNQNQ